MKRRTAQVLYKMRGKKEHYTLMVDVTSGTPKDFGPVIARWLNVRDENVIIIDWHIAK